MSRLFLSLLLLALASGQANAGFDHELPLDQNGIWARSYQTGLENGVIALEVAGSLWFGNDDELGHTFWQTIDASTISGIGASVLKYAFSRARPYLRISRMSVHGFITCQANISFDVGPRFHGMPVQDDAGRGIVSESRFGVNDC